MTSRSGSAGCGTVVAYDAARHEVLLHALWQRSFDEKWAVRKSILHMLFAPKGSGVVAVEGDRLVGFAGTAARERALAVILVEPESRRRGIATALLRTALDTMSGAGRIAIGGLAFLWKGIPTDLAPAMCFFRARGCVFTTTIVDQYRELRDFQFPEAVESDAQRQGLRLHRGTKADAQRILAFENEHFPHWATYFESCIEEGRYTDIACVSSPTRIVGATLLGRPGTTFPGSQWNTLVDGRLGSYATLGIDPAYRGRGLGYALSAFATRAVRDDGAAACFINHSEAVSLYRKLGFREWAQYRAAEIAV